MVAAKIFISHSVDNENKVEVNLLWALNDVLTKKGFEVLLDMARINEDIGGRWRSTLNTWIEICDSAILVFNERARDRSNWVVYESAILAWRKCADPSFQLVTLVIPPADATELGKLRFEPHALHELQTVACRFEGIDACLTKILDTLEPLRQRFEQSNALDESKAPPAALVEARLVTILKKVADKDAIIRAARCLGADLGRWCPNLDHWKALARLLLQADLVRACETVANELVSLDTREMVRIREFLAPAWVDWRAVSPIPSVALASDSTKRLIALNAERVDTMTAYLNRAAGQPEDRRWISFTMTGLSSQTAAELAETISRSLATRLRRSEADQRKRLNDISNKRPLFALLVGPEPTDTDLAALRSEMAAVTFFVSTKAQADSEADFSPQSGAFLLHPLLEPDAEEQAYERYLNACEVIQDI